MSSVKKPTFRGKSDVNKIPPSFAVVKKASLTSHPAKLDFGGMGLPFNMDVDAAEGMACLPMPSTTAKPCADIGGHSINDDDDVFAPAAKLCPKKLDADFAELEKRKASTSTPTGTTRTLSVSSTVTGHDSGFNESTWSTTFAETISIASESFETPSIIQDDDLDDPLLSMPMPRMFLKFSDADDPMECRSSQHGDSAFGDCSSIASNCQCSSQSLHQHSDPSFDVVSEDLDSFGDLPSPRIICSRSLETPTQAPSVYSSTPFTASVSTIVEQIVKEFSPSVPSRLIGRNMGLPMLDVVSELSFLDLSEPLSLIMEHLDDENICRMCCVSRQWKSVCETSATAQQKKQDLVDRQRAVLEERQKENMHLKGTRKKVTGGNETPLAVVQDLVEEEVVPKTPLPLPTNYQQFVQQASHLKCDESLRMCPSCRKPARVHEVQERGQCTNRKCGLDFCIKCNSNFHGSRECSVASKKSRTDGTVGTKKSKKNLRRL